MTHGVHRIGPGGGGGEMDLGPEERAFRRELLQAAERLDHPSPDLEQRLSERLSLLQPGAARSPGWWRRPWVMGATSLGVAACVALVLAALRSSQTDVGLAQPEPVERVVVPTAPVRKVPAHPCDRRFRAPGTSPLIDDFEDGDGHVHEAEGRSFLWFLHYDYDREGEVTRVPRSEPIEGAGRGNHRALHLTGGTLRDWGAVLEVPFSPHYCYDASAYAGLSFRAKGPGRVFVGAREVRVVPTRWGGTCEADCYNVHAAAVSLDSDWKQYDVPWSKMRQRGYDTPPLDPTSLHSLQWHVHGEDTPFDLWIDDVRFIEK